MNVWGIYMVYFCKFIKCCLFIITIESIRSQEQNGRNLVSIATVVHKHGGRMKTLQTKQPFMGKELIKHKEVTH